MQIILKKTCSWAPEQYDAFIGETQVGFLHLRHGKFTVECPSCDGELVFSACNEWGGRFFDHDREFYLSHAKIKISEWVARNDV